MAEAVDRAVALATAEPPGPVHLEFPEDAAVGEARETPSPLARAATHRRVAGVLRDVVD